MSDRLRFATKINGANVPVYVDKNTFEHTFAPTAIFYEDDFMAAAKQTFQTAVTPGQDWVKKTQQTAGTPTFAAVANSAFGQVQGALDATNEKQEATLYWGDVRNLPVNLGLVIEARIKLSVLPSAAGVQAFWGAAAAWIDGPDNNTRYVEFGATANGTILMRSQDGTTQNSIATDTTVLATDFHIYRIDLTDLTDVKYFIDGVQVSAAKQIAFADATAVLQPMLGVYKTASAGVATIVADYVRFYSNRS